MPKPTRYNEKRDLVGLFLELVTEYKTFVESEHPKAAEAVCQADMFNEIAHRFFKIADVIKDKDFCEIFGIEVK